MCPMCPWMWGWGGWGWWSPIWGIVMLVFWLLVLAGLGLVVLWFVRQIRPGEAAAGRSRALEILQERYARGEITREQYEQMRRDLEGPRG